MEVIGSQLGHVREYASSASLDIALSDEMMAAWCVILPPLPLQWMFLVHVCAPPGGKGQRREEGIRGGAWE